MVKPLGAGDRIESRCTRCNDITGHIIMALVNGSIVKVQCVSCRSEHKYHAPAAERRSKKAETVCRVKHGEDRKNALSAIRVTTPKPAASSRPATRKAQNSALEKEQVWQRTLNSTVATATPYSIQASYACGDVVDHPTFGLGVVQTVQGDRMQLLFREGVKLLKCQG